MLLSILLKRRELILLLIDDDPYLDTAFGIITSRNVTDLKNYVDKLITYIPPEKMKIYSIDPPCLYENLILDYGINLKSNCLTNCAQAYCVCDGENRATSDKIMENVKNVNILVINAHGSPSSISLDNGEEILGSINGILLQKNTGEIECKSIGGMEECGPRYEKLPLQLDGTILTIGQSCTTGRINGLPGVVNENLCDYKGEGYIETSLVLSFLQSGSLNYIASTRIASGFFPEETLIEESFLQGVPIGIAIKDFKNRYMMLNEQHKISLPGSPAITDSLTENYILFNTRNWILFGDPSIVLSNERYKPKNCIKEYSETQNGNKKHVRMAIKFKENGKLLGNAQDIGLIEDVDCYAPTGQFSGYGDICVVKIPYKNKLKDIKVISVSGVDERYLDNPYPANAFYQDLGNEIFIRIPRYVAVGGQDHIEPIILNYEIISE